MRPALAALVLVAAAAAPAADRHIPEAAPAGPAVSCIPLHQIQQSRVRDDRTIDFVMAGRRVYRNVLPQGCPQLGFEQRFGYATSQGELCSTDVITVLHDGGVPQGATCGLGRFQPVTLAKP